MIAADLDVNGIAQGGEAHQFNRTASGHAHFEQAMADVAFARKLLDFPELAGDHLA